MRNSVLCLLAVLVCACTPVFDTPRTTKAFAVTPPYLTRVAITASAAVAPTVVASSEAVATAARPSPIATMQETEPRSYRHRPPNLQTLRQVLLDAVNADRAAAGLRPVQLDDLSSQVGQAHAEEMAANGYMSHWNLKGLGPDLRYSIAGGRDAVMENAYMSWNRYSNGIPVPVGDWNQVVLKAEADWMSSPGHRANILKPEHTHVGIGIAYNPETGDIRMTQEFVNRYVELDALPPTTTAGDTLAVSGRLLPGASAPLVNLAYEPAPRPMTVAELNATGAYASPAQIVSTMNAPADAQGRFRVNVPLARASPSGVYHVRVWITWQGRSVLAAGPLVWVDTSTLK